MNESLRMSEVFIVWQKIRKKSKKSMVFLVLVVVVIIWFWLT
jgi:hypothetical protein